MVSKAVFIDRDDTIAKDVPYCDDPAKFEIYPFVPSAIAAFVAISPVDTVNVTFVSPARKSTSF